MDVRRIKLTSGETVAYPIFDRRGRLLLNGGAPTDPDVVRRLAAEGIEDIVVTDQDDPVIPAECGFPQDVRTRMAEALADIEDWVIRALNDRGLQAEDIAENGVPRGTISTEPFMRLEGLMKEFLAAIADHRWLYPRLPLPIRPAPAAEHGLEVGIVAAQIGVEMGLRENVLRDLALGALLHDIGKLTLPVNLVLEDISLWTPEELRLYRIHPMVGAAVVQRGFPDAPVIAATVRSHHERQDGRGFPRGLRSTNENNFSSPSQPSRIPPTAEVCAIADYYCHLTNDRVEMPEAQAVSQVYRAAGGRYNAAVAQVLRKLVPAHMPGTFGVLRGPAYNGYGAVVVRQSERFRDRPVVRLLTDEKGMLVDAGQGPVDLTDMHTTVFEPASPFVGNRSA